MLLNITLKHVKRNQETERKDYHTEALHMRVLELVSSPCSVFPNTKDSCPHSTAVYKKFTESQVWWNMTIIPAHGGLKQKDCQLLS